MSHQSDAADAIYRRLASEEFPLARLVLELRAQWGPEHPAAEVHRFADEVGALLLRNEDVEVGDITDGKFTGWPLDAWDAEKKLERELMSAPDFLDDERRYVFRKKQANQPATGQRP